MDFQLELVRGHEWLPKSEELRAYVSYRGMLLQAVNDESLQRPVSLRDRRRLRSQVPGGQPPVQQSIAE
jgi:hypothetical protein